MGNEGKEVITNVPACLRKFDCDESGRWHQSNSKPIVVHTLRESEG